MSGDIIYVLQGLSDQNNYLFPPWIRLRLHLTHLFSQDLGKAFARAEEEPLPHHLSTDDVCGLF